MGHYVRLSIISEETGTPESTMREAIRLSKIEEVGADLLFGDSGAAPTGIGAMKEEGGPVKISKEKVR